MKTQSRTSEERVPARRGADDAPNGTSVAAQTGTLPVRTSTPRPGGSVTIAPAAVPVAPSETVVEEAAPARGPISWLTLESGLYVLFFILALATRFLDLGTKGLHHDESLHAVYSWKYYMDQGYIHSPMMHGPEQFHFIDLFYLLFGATDATARFASATCGVFIVMAPVFLRRQLGRWPALIATFLLLISPGFMYFTRFAREDAIYAAMEMLFVLGLWRFIDERKPRDFYVLCAGYSLMFTIKESAYLTTAVIGLLLVGLFAWQMGRALFATFAGYLALAGGTALYILKIANAPKLPNIPAQDPTPDAISAFVMGLVGHPLIQAVALVTVAWLGIWTYLIVAERRRLAGTIAARAAESAPISAEPTAIAEATPVELETVPLQPVDEATAPVEATEAGPNGNGAGAYVPTDDVVEGLEMEGEPGPVAPPVPARRAVRQGTPRVRGLLDLYQPGSVPYAAGWLLRHPSVLGTGIAIAALLYVALYTSMFTNINGIGTGMFGSVGYWLAQQDVRRGDQPWFYYFILIPIYEPLIILFGFTAIFYFAVRGIRAVRARRSLNPPSDGEAVPGASRGFNAGRPVAFGDFRPFLVLFLAFWFLGATALYSWAGEKMPWLMIHMVQPLAFLAALALGQLVKSMIRNRRRRSLLYEPDEEAFERPVAVLTRPTSWVPFFSFLSLFTIVSVFWAMSITHRVMNNDYANWWQLLIWPALLLLVIAGYWSLVGGGRVLRFTLVALGVLLTVYGIRSAVQLSFYNEMDAREMAVYVQTSPDVTRAADTIDRLSIDQTGTRDLKVMYDSLASWPWEWYLRDYKNKQFQPDGPATAPGTDVAVLVLDSAWYDKAKSGQAPQLNNYVGNKYPMRWWFPEDTYRNFIPSTWDNLDPKKPVKDDGSPNYQLDAAGKQVKGPIRQFQGALDTILYTLKTPSEQGKMWKYLVYREPYAALGSTDFAVFVRKDLADRFNYLASLKLPNYDSLTSR